MRRFCQLLAESVPGLQVADGMLDVRGDVPEPFVVSVPIARVHRQIGVALGPAEIAGLIEPIGFTVLETDLSAGDGVLAVEVPTNRPDVRPEPYGVDDVIEEIARTFGYSNVPSRVPAWPQPGGLTPRQRALREVKDVLRGLGASEAWTDTFLSAGAHDDVDLIGPAVMVANPLDAEKPYLRRSLLPGLLGALAYNAGRRQPDVRLFEVGVVFSHPGAGKARVVERSGAGGTERAELPGERELASVVLAHGEDDARVAVAAWHVLADALRLQGVRLVRPGDGSPPLPGLHPTRSAHLMVRAGTIDEITIGSVGEVDPAVVARFDLTRTAGGGTVPRRVGWLEVDLGLLLDEDVVPRRITVGGAVSRFPSSDIDLAFVVDDSHPADAVADALRSAGGELLESVHLFDVYRGAGIDDGSRSLAYRLRFCADDRTLTDEEVGELRSGCIDEVVAKFGASLR